MAQTKQLWDPLVAARYDHPDDPMKSPEVIEPAVALLADLAEGGTVLEFVSGSGRVALNERELEAAGIGSVNAMLDVLRARLDAERLTLVENSSTSSVVVPERFSLVFLVFNGITDLLTQDEQVSCFRIAAEHLRPGGRFLVETYVPNLQRLAPGYRFLAFDVRPSHIGFDDIDVVGQHVMSHHLAVNDGVIATVDVPHRYVWPAECDLMARMAGMHLEQRWADWERAPFDNTSRSHISVYVLDDEPPDASANAPPHGAACARADG